jgi:hypothetical protein
LTLECNGMAWTFFIEYLFVYSKQSPYSFPINSTPQVTFFEIWSECCHQLYTSFIAYVGIYWQPLWSSGQNSWLEIQRSGFDSRRYHIFWEVVGLERGPLSLVSTIKEPLGRKSSGSSLESREYGSRDPSRWPRGSVSTKFCTNVADKWLSLGRYSSLAV